MARHLLVPHPTKQTSSWIQGCHQHREGPCRITKQIKQWRVSGQPANKNILSEDAVRWALCPTQQWAANLGFRCTASPHIWRGCNHQCRTVLEIRYSGYQEVDSTSTSLAKHALIFKVFFYKSCVLSWAQGEIMRWENLLGWGWSI